MKKNIIKWVGLLIFLMIIATILIIFTRLTILQSSLFGSVFGFLYLVLFDIFYDKYLKRKNK